MLSRWTIRQMNAFSQVSFDAGFTISAIASRSNEKQSCQRFQLLECLSHWTAVECFGIRRVGHSLPHGSELHVEHA